MRSIGSGLAALAAVCLAAGAAQAVPQFTPATDDRLHTFLSGQPGAQWNTSGVGAGGSVSYSSGSQTLSITGVLDVVNYWNPTNGSCPTDSGSNCAFNYGPDLDISLQASLVDVVVTSLGGGLYTVQANFQTTGGVDLSVTDPADGNSVMLEAAWQAGSFLGNPTTGLSASLVFDDNTNTVSSGTLNAGGFLAVDLGTLYASLFAPTYFGLQFSTLSDFSPSLNSVADAVVEAFKAAGNPTTALPSFSAEANGQVFRTDTGEFVPEPGLALLLGAGAAVALARRLRSR